MAQMSANAFAISRRLSERGVDKKIADAVAEEIVTHSDDNLATKTDIARLEGEIKTLSKTLGGQINSLTTQVKWQTTMITGLYVGLAILYISRLL